MAADSDVAEAVSAVGRFRVAYDPGRWDALRLDRARLDPGDPTLDVVRFPACEDIARGGRRSSSVCVCVCVLERAFFAELESLL